MARVPEVALIALSVGTRTLAPVGRSLSERAVYHLPLRVHAKHFRAFSERILRLFCNCGDYIIKWCLHFAIHRDHNCEYSITFRNIASVLNMFRVVQGASKSQVGLKTYRSCAQLLILSVFVAEIRRKIHSGR